jgi:hypothetical protein
MWKLVKKVVAVVTGVVLALGFAYSWHCRFVKTIELTFKTVSQDHIELQDTHGCIIHLTLNG